MAAPIDSLIVTGSTWDTFGTWMNRTNQIIVRVNGVGSADAVTITGGSIEGVTIGAASSVTAILTTLKVTNVVDFTGATVQFTNDSLSGDIINGGTITVNYAELNNAPTADNHATTKLYVDTAVKKLENQLVAWSLIFGG